MAANYLNRNQYLLSIICLSFSFIISAFLLNRASIVGSIAGIIFLLFNYNKVQLSKKVFSLCTVLFLFIITVLAIYVKSDSSLGRLLIYKISWSMFIEHPFTGIGWGNFQRDYGLYQARYFELGNYTQKEFLLADNTFYAFNDYWQFIVENGIVGGVGLITFISLTICICYNRLKNNDKNLFLSLLVAICLVICVAALLTHIFENKPFAIAVFVILVYIMFYNRIAKLKTKSRVSSFLSILLVVSLAFYYTDIRNIKNYQKLEKAKALAEFGYLNESRELFTTLYPSLRNDINFLRAFSETLLGPSMQHKKITLLQEIIAQYSDNYTFLKIGQIYEQLNMSKQAERAFLQAVYMVPNRIVPKEALFNHYIKNKQYPQAKYWRNIILTMPVKIPSERIKTIKQTVKNKNF